MSHTVILILAGIVFMFGTVPAGWMYYRPMFRKQRLHEEES